MTAVTSAQTGNDNNTKPGWGYGDDNHVHTGPPGQSVPPGQHHHHHHHHHHWWRFWNQDD